MKLVSALDAGLNRILNLGTPTAATDASTKGYVDGLVNPFLGVWGAYTPTLTSDGNQPSISSVVTGLYMTMGKTVFVRGEIAVTSVTTAGTGAYRISLPVAPRISPNPSMFLGTCEVSPTNVNFFTGYAWPSSSGASFAIWLPTSTTPSKSQWGGGVLIGGTALGANGKIRWGFAYETV